jgi:hypothetical protein
MARKPLNILMNIGSGRTVLVPVPQSIIDYFNLTAAVVAGATTGVARERKAHTRRVFNRDSLTTTVVKTVGVGVSRWQDVGGRKRGGRGSGKLIKIPTELLYDTANPAKGHRLVSLRIPNAATNYAIAMWINTVFTAHKPAYFLTPSGQQYPVAVPNIADPNPGNRGGAAPAPAPAPAA